MIAYGFKQEVINLGISKVKKNLYSHLLINEMKSLYTQY